MAGSGAGFSEVSPLQPNHTPPVCWSAARTPTARPPGAAPRLGSEMRLDTQTNRLMWFHNARARDQFPALRLPAAGIPGFAPPMRPGCGGLTIVAVPAKGAVLLPHLQPAHAGPESQGPYLARRHVQRQNPDAGIVE